MKTPIKTDIIALLVGNMSSRLKDVWNQYQHITNIWNYFQNFEKKKKK